LLSWLVPILQLLCHSSFSYEMNWKWCGLSQESPPTIVCDSIRVLQEDDDIVKIEACIWIRSKEEKKNTIQHVSIYTIYRDERILLSNKVKPLASLLSNSVSSLPRVGISFRVNPVFCNIQYFGRGPSENYPDRKNGSHLGWWKTTPSDMGYSYIVPSENGSRSDCTMIRFEKSSSSNSGGCHEGGIQIIADSDTSFSCSALNYSASELHRATHTCDLVEQGINNNDHLHPIHVNIDHKLMGVAGDNSWSPCVYEEYLVNRDEYIYKLWFTRIPKRTATKRK